MYLKNEIINVATSFLVLVRSFFYGSLFSIKVQARRQIPKANWVQDVYFKCTLKVSPDIGVCTRSALHPSIIERTLTSINWLTQVLQEQHGRAGIAVVSGASHPAMHVQMHVRCTCQTSSWREFGLGLPYLNVMHHDDGPDCRIS